jgi:hypothetical protein
MGILSSKSAPQLEREQTIKREEEQSRRDLNEQPIIIDNLSAHVRKCWSKAKMHRSKKSGRLTTCLRLRQGKYHPEKLAKIRERGGSEAYMNLVGTKSQALKSWLSDLYASSNDKPFSLEPTPVPDLDPNIQNELIQTALQVLAQTMPGASEEQVMQMAGPLLEKHEERIKDEVKQEADARMERMSDYIEDLMAESNWREEFEEFLDDLGTFPFAVMKGIIYRVDKQASWEQDPETGKYKIKVVDKISRRWKRVSPFNFYESPNMSKIGEGWTIEHLQFTKQDLAKMRGAKGYNTANIEAALSQHRNGGLREWAFDSGERERLEGKQTSFDGSYDLIDGLEYSGTIQGTQLIEWGITQSIEDRYHEYPCTIVVVGQYTICARINSDPSGRPPYYVSTFRTIPNSFMGESLPEVLEDVQDAANAAIRSLINNMAIGGQPMAAIDVSRMQPGEKVTNIYPGKQYLYTSSAGQNGAGVSFFSPEIKSQELLTIYERFERYADEKSGIPAYAYGSDNAAGAGKTASGLQMLMNATSKGIKEIVRRIDIHVIEPIVTALYNSAMIDPEVADDHKGDAKVKARGSDALMHKEATAMRQIEFMSMTNNPVDNQLIGVEGRLSMLGIAAKNSDFPTDRIVPTFEEFQQRQMANAEPSNDEASAPSAQAS